ncbi:DNA polymerase, partial [uncultured Halomonas sp.]|uniref:DNA polymerase n=1 Tax=uncultured Halomonas sp. TaxID=173971 RepID=UPI0026375633
MSNTPFAIIDLETTIKFSYKRKANPFDPENWIVMAGALEAEERWGKAYYYLNREESHRDDWFRSLLKRTKLLVGFNFKFDIHHLIQCPENYEAWMDWIAAGGTIWDCQLAEYLLNGMGAQDQYLSLDEVAPRYGGNLKVDEVKLLWEDGVDTPDIDRDLLERYLVGEPETGDEGDLGNTRLIFRGQLARARKSGQLKSLLLNMGSLVYTIEAEHQGMAVDYELGCKLAAEREAELAALTEELTKFIPDDLPFEFNWGSRNHLSALIFGGQVKYVAKAPILDDDGNLTYYQKEIEETVLDDDGSPVIFKSGKRKGEVKTKKVKVPDLERGPKERNEDFYYTFPGFTKPRKEWETKTPGVYSTAADTIEALGNRGIPFLDTLSEHSAVSKDLKTYFITTDEKTGEKKGMLTLVDNGIIHHSLNHVNTVTGRFSSSNPNLQNLSGKGKSKVKSLFVSRYPNGKVIQSDFTSLEIYIQAVLTGCRQLIDDLKAGLDMHCLRVSQKERIPYEEAVRLCKVEEVPEWVSKRKGAKEFSFQRAYGAGIAKIAETTGMTEEEV